MNLAKTTKPSNFAEFQKAAQAILEKKGINYLEWLHELHTQEVHKVVSENPVEVAALVMKNPN